MLLDITTRVNDPRYLEYTNQTFRISLDNTVGEFKQLMWRRSQRHALVPLALIVGDPSFTDDTKMASVVPTGGEVKLTVVGDRLAESHPPVYVCGVSLKIESAHIVLMVEYNSLPSLQAAVQSAGGDMATLTFNNKAVVASLEKTVGLDLAPPGLAMAARPQRFSLRLISSTNSTIVETSIFETILEVKQALQTVTGKAPGDITMVYRAHVAKEEETVGGVLGVKTVPEELPSIHYTERPVETKVESAAIEGGFGGAQPTKIDLPADLGNDTGAVLDALTSTSEAGRDVVQSTRLEGTCLETRAPGDPESVSVSEPAFTTGLVPVSPTRAPLAGLSQSPTAPPTGLIRDGVTYERVRDGAGNCYLVNQDVLSGSGEYTISLGGESVVLTTSECKIVAGYLAVSPGGITKLERLRVLVEGRKGPVLEEEEGAIPFSTRVSPSPTTLPSTPPLRRGQNDEPQSVVLEGVVGMTEGAGMVMPDSTPVNVDAAETPAVVAPVVVDGAPAGSFASIRRVVSVRRANGELSSLSTLCFAMGRILAIVYAIESTCGLSKISHLAYLMLWTICCVISFTRRDFLLALEHIAREDPNRWVRFALAAAHENCAFIGELLHDGFEGIVRNGILILSHRPARVNVVVEMVEALVKDLGVLVVSVVPRWLDELMVEISREQRKRQTLLEAMVPADTADPPVVEESTQGDGTVVEATEADEEGPPESDAPLEPESEDFQPHVAVEPSSLGTSSGFQAPPALPQ